MPTDQNLGPDLPPKWQSQPKIDEILFQLKTAVSNSNACSGITFGPVACQVLLNYIERIPAQPADNVPEPDYDWRLGRHLLMKVYDGPTLTALLHIMNRLEDLERQVKR
jgi:hypothetical protein